MLPGMFMTLSAVFFLSLCLSFALHRATRKRLEAENAILSRRIATIAEVSSRQIQVFARVSTIISSSFERDRLLSQILLVLCDYWPGCAVRLLVYGKDGSLARIGLTDAESFDGKPLVHPSDENLLGFIATASGGKRNPEWDLFLDEGARKDYVYNFPFVSEERFKGTLVLSSPAALDESSRLFLGDIAGLIASAHQNVLTVRERNIINEQFGRSVDPRVRDHLLSAAESGSILDVTVLFLDIRDFTGISERLGPTETVRFLNGIFTSCEGVIHEEGGFINKFTGDGFMAVFGAPVGTETHPSDAVRAALKITGVLGEVPLGIGVASGLALAGTIGSSERMEYTVIGDTVNTAARLEGLCKIFGSSILVSGTTHDRLGGDKAKKEGCASRFLGNVRLKGKSTAIALYELSGSITSFPEAKDFDAAIGSYYRADFSASRAKFAELSSRFPADKAVTWYLERCAERLSSESGEEWDGVERMTMK